MKKTIASRVRKDRARILAAVLRMLSGCIVSGLCLFPVSPGASQKAAEHEPNETKPEGCVRFEEGSIVQEPQDLRSENGLLRVELFFRSHRKPDGKLLYCFMTKEGTQSPNLRVQPGDTVVLILKNEARVDGGAADGASHGRMAPSKATGTGGESKIEEVSCAGIATTPGATNIHFHGLDVAPVCHQDDTLHTFVEPGAPPFEYQLKIPKDHPPGMYWYHPHVHGQGKEQILGGASGVLIVEGLERANSQVKGLPERVFVIRDEDLKNANAEPSKTGAGQPPVRRDAEGDILNAGTGTGKPAKDLSINFVSVPYPEYPPAKIRMKPEERQLWRVLNASAITYIGLQVMANGRRQAMGVVAFDGVPWDLRGRFANGIVQEKYILLPPGGRVEFVVKAPAEGQKEQLMTRSVDTGPLGENDPWRPLATIEGTMEAPEPRATLRGTSEGMIAWNSTLLEKVSPVRERKLYFSEEPQDPKDPESPTKFYITVAGEKPVVFDANSKLPNITVRQGTVEDWTIENRSQELHTFHIHQIHFMVLESSGRGVGEPSLRDTVNVPYWNGKSSSYPSVRLRMDFRSPRIVGIFPYHCHLLEHQDGGMMGTIRVEPADWIERTR
jgi:FtsP/CotA-like multicopper oxidase with cupredoxin domain